jgi:hypothetical protein
MSAVFKDKLTINVPYYCLMRIIRVSACNYVPSYLFYYFVHLFALESLKFYDSIAKRVASVV